MKTWSAAILCSPAEKSEKFKFERSIQHYFLSFM